MTTVRDMPDLLAGAVAVASQGPTSYTPEGAPIHDRFDARTGYPVTGTYWLSVETSSAAAAGGWADAIFALGPEGGPFVDRKKGLRAVIVTNDDQTWQSDELRFTPSLP